MKEQVLMQNGFCEMSNDEMMELDGGVNWDLVGATIATGGGAYIGAKIGTVGGPVGMVVGGIAGGAIGAIVYSAWD